jgi:hypothetical protein
MNLSSVSSWLKKLRGASSGGDRTAPPSSVPAPGQVAVGGKFIPPPMTVPAVNISPGQSVAAAMKKAPSITEPPRMTTTPVVKELIASAEASMVEDLAAGRVAEAFQTYIMGGTSWSYWQPPASILDRLARGLYAAKSFKEARRCAQALIDSHPEEALMARLIIASLTITEDRRPTAALRQLDALAQTALKPQQQQQIAQLRAKAQAMIAKGVLEIDD